VKQEDEERAVQLGCEEGKVCRRRWGKVLLLGGKGREVLTMLGLGDQRRRFSCLLASRPESLGTPGYRRFVGRALLDSQPDYLKENFRLAKTVTPCS